MRVDRCASAGLLTLVFSVCGCAADDTTPACLLTTLSSTLTYEGAPSCDTPIDSLPGAWVDLNGCQVRVLLPLGAACDEVGGLPSEGSAGRERCLIPRLEVTDRSAGAALPEGRGWFWDDFSDDAPCPRDRPPNTIRLLPEPPLGTELELSCAAPVAPGEGPNARCDAALACTDGLVCDPLRQRCTAACATDADCEDAGLRGWTCDLRPRAEIDPRSRDAASHRHCINPSCEP